MSQKSTITWIIVVIVVIVIIILGWWWYSASQSPSTSNTPTQSTQTSQALITSFSLVGGLNPTADGVIDNNNSAIMLEVPKGTDVTKLTPTIVVSNGGTVSPASGMMEDFTNPVTYTVTGQDGSTQTYTVTVTIATDSVSVSSKTGIGQFLVDAKSMTLYYFLTDTKGSGQSACTGSCATLWPPFYAANVVVSTPLKTSDFSMVTRTDGQQGNGVLIRVTSPSN